MKNIINIKPTEKLHGRALYNTVFIDEVDIVNKDILDVGCGYGWFELNAYERGCKKIVGIELLDQDLETARDNINSSMIEFCVGDAVALPFKEKCFDTVVSWEVIEHISSGMEKDMFIEVSRVLKNGGTFYLSTPLNNVLSNIFDPAWWLIDHRHYNRCDLIKFSEKCGLVLEKVVLSGGIWGILWINNLYIAKWIFRRKPFFEDFFNKKQDKEYLAENGFTNIFVKFRKV